MSEQQIDFGFLRECIQALKEFHSSSFAMQRLFFQDPNERNVCGTPSCVLGHWAAWRVQTKRVSVGGKGWRHPVNAAMDVLMSPSNYGLTEDQKDELFESTGCNRAPTKEAAIAYIERFIIRHGGGLAGSLVETLAQEPTLESVSSGWLVRTPDWNQLIEQPVAEEVEA